MDELYSKSPKLVNDEKFNDLIMLFKSKTKNLTSDQIDHLFDYSLSRSLQPLTLLVLHLRLKSIKRIPMNAWDKWLSLTADFLIGTRSLFLDDLRKKFFKLAWSYSETCCEIGVNYQDYIKKGFHTLLEVLNGINDQEEITPIHANVCKMALMLKKVYDIEHLVSQNYSEVRKSSGVTGVQCVLFFYYLASVALILEKHSRASYFYNLAITMPSQNVHSAMLESYKKQVLIQLITEGSEYHIPKSAPTRFGSYTRHHSCDPYSKLAGIFVDYLKGRATKLNVMSFITKNKNVWIADANVGLIKKVIVALLKHKIKKLTQVYASLSFSQLKRETEENDSLDLLIKMIENNEINAKIDRKNENVLFFDKEDLVRAEEIQDVCEEVLKCSKFIEKRIENVCFDSRYLKQMVLTENLGK